jgi:hypothetical protein
MALRGNSRLYNVRGLLPGQKTRILDFLQGAVYCWCKNRPKEWFSLRDLMGGDNYYWPGTPLLPLYDKHVAAGSSDPIAVDRAGKEGGWLLKEDIVSDSRVFDTRLAFRIRQYRWNQPASPINPNLG